MDGFPYIDLVFLAVVAGFILFRLYTVLGRRTGNERTPEERVGLTPRPRQGAPETSPPETAKTNVIPMPEPVRGSVQPAEAVATDVPSGAVGRALLDIKLADRRFDTAHFVAGARAAYEIVVTAFAKGERETLQPLLSDEVYATFEGAIRAREARKERVDFTFLGLKAARVTGADMKGRTAEITVTFDAEFILAGYDPDGKLVEGDPKQPHSVTEIWTFARQTNASDPNWTLVATAGGG